MAVHVIFIFLLISVTFTPSLQQKNSNISLGSSLTPTSNISWMSPSGFFAFGFYQRANNGYHVGIFMAGIPQKTVVWTANRDNPPIQNDATLNLTGDGRLVLQSPRGEEAIATNLSESAVAAAAMLDSGNFVLYGPDQEMIWQSFDHPTNTLLPGQRLYTEYQLFSSLSENDDSTGRFRIKMQRDGNLVQYPVHALETRPFAYWESDTDGKGDNMTLNLGPDGRLYLLNSAGSNVMNVTAGGYPMKETLYFMRIDVDGNFRVYQVKRNQDPVAIWNSSNDRCAPKGICGLNAYCDYQGALQVNCTCLPMFARNNGSEFLPSCVRNFVPESCVVNNNSSVTFTYSMETISSLIWADTPYDVIKSPTQEDCVSACLRDCMCEAATYNAGYCSKQRLPLRFGRIQSSDSSVSLIKVSNYTTEIFNDRNGNSSSKSKGRKEPQITNIVLLAIGISLTVFGFIMSLCGLLVVYRNGAGAYKRVSNNNSNVEFIEDVALKSFTYAELETATNNFNEELGRGAFGTVFKGKLSNGRTIVAVKRLNTLSTEGDKEFQTEMKVIARTHHRNLVRLFGYCNDGSSRLLVYKFMSNGSLADILFTPEKRPCWKQRMDIACNIANGLLYLHEECETRIIHCDIKPQNILMDENMCPKISDFGLAKLLMQDQTKTFTGIRGTRGYVAPEWHKNLPITVKADVYSFGIVLLEIICCRRSVDWELSEDEAILEEWVYKCFQSQDLGKLVGDEEVDYNELERIVRIGVWCIQDEPSLRPSIKMVLLMLEGSVDVPMLPHNISFTTCDQTA